MARKLENDLIINRLMVLQVDDILLLEMSQTAWCHLIQQVPLALFLFLFRENLPDKGTWHRTRCAQREIFPLFFSLFYLGIKTRDWNMIN